MNLRKLVLIPLISSLLAVVSFGTVKMGGREYREECHEASYPASPPFDYLECIYTERDTSRLNYGAVINTHKEGSIKLYNIKIISSEWEGKERKKYYINESIGIGNDSYSFLRTSAIHFSGNNLEIILKKGGSVQGKYKNGGGNPGDINFDTFEGVDERGNDKWFYLEGISQIYNITPYKEK